MESHARTIVKADPGWFVCFYWREDSGEEGLLRQPVIAWEFDRVEGKDPRGDGQYSVLCVNPITTEGSTSDRECFAVLDPYGVYDFPGLIRVDGYEECLSVFRREGDLAKE